jgi:ABC-type multidrug transport system ATPase subunit
VRSARDDGNGIREEEGVMETPVIAARGVTKAYGHHRVLANVDLTVPAGALIAVVGENGAGKSTLLQILAGTLAADSGTIDLRGSLGYCPQLPVLNAALSVDQHLRYFAAAYRLANLGRADELIDLLGYGEYRRRVVEELSGGTRQKLNLTLALMHDPDVLLLDEPYQGFDWETYLRFWDIVDDLRMRGRAVVVITHLVFEEDRFDGLYRLAEGRTEPTAPTHDMRPRGGHVKR